MIKGAKFGKAETFQILTVVDISFHGDDVDLVSNMILNTDILVCCARVEYSSNCVLF